MYTSQQYNNRVRLRSIMTKHFDSKIPVSNLGIEDACTIDYVVCLKKSSLKSFFYHLFSVFTLGFFWLLGYWSAKVKSRLKYNQCTLQQATDFMTYNWDNKWSIIPRQDMLVLSSKSSFKDSITFSNRFIRYFYDQIKEIFVTYQYNIASKLKQLKSGEIFLYSTQQRQILQKQFGRCLIQVKVKSMIVMFFGQLFSPYEMFQLYAIIYWLFEQYYIFPIVLLVASIATYIYDVNLLQKGQRKLRSDSLVAAVISFLVKNNNNSISLQKSHSETLIPGDLFYITQKQKIPCDCIIIKGSALLNEQYLTGNSSPCRKSQISNFQLTHSTQSNSMLYMGTQIIYIQHQQLHNTLPNIPDAEYKSILCLAIRTNYSCTRGQYLRSIIYPKPHAFKLFTQSVSFLIIMFFINALGFFIIMMKIHKQVSNTNKAYVFFDLLTTAIPPTLPTAMTVGIGFALQRLSSLDIKCMVKLKILVGGRVDKILIQSPILITKGETHVLGFIPNIPQKQMQLKMIKNKDSNDSISKLISTCMVTTLSVCRCQSDGRYIGSVIDIQILKFLNAQLLDDNITINIQNQTISIEDKQYLQNNIIESTSIINNQTNKFIRGSPALCEQTSISPNTQDIITKLISKDYQIIALAHKIINIQQTKYQFLGFIVISERRQYDHSTTVMKSLKTASIHTIILSKQNSINAINTAQKCQLITNKKDLLFCQLISDLNGGKRVHRSYIQTSSHIQFSDNKQQHSNAASTEDELTKDFVFAIDEGKPLDICMTGSLLQQLYTRKSILSIRYILQKTIIFCDLQQRHYNMIVEAYQQLDHLVSIVGDNVRDNAFKRADVGLALTSSDLQALSHFSTRKQNINSIVNLFRIAKAALSCNFQTFRMMCLFSLTQFTTYVILYLDYQELNNAQNLYIDFFIMCPIFICLSLTSPCSKLTKQKPSASLFSLANVLSMVGLFIIQLLSQLAIVSYIRSNRHLIEFEKDSLEYIRHQHDFNTGTYQVTTLFVFSNFLYLGIALATSVSRPFRKEFYTNIPLVINIVLLWAYNVILPFDILVPNSMEIRHLQGNWVGIIILLANLICIIMYLYQNIILTITKKIKGKWQFD